MEPGFTGPVEGLSGGERMVDGQSLDDGNGENSPRRWGPYIECKSWTEQAVCDLVGIPSCPGKAQECSPLVHELQEHRAGLRFQLRPPTEEITGIVSSPISRVTLKIWKGL